MAMATQAAQQAMQEQVSQKQATAAAGALGQQARVASQAPQLQLDATESLLQLQVHQDNKPEMR